MLHRHIAIAFSLTLLTLGAGKAEEAADRAATLYYQGLPEVEATLPSAGLTLPSTAMPCVNCHGADGRGGREGGVAVPPISWRHLGMASADRPAYDAALLKRALRDGIGADGEALHDIMPRYTLSDPLARELARWLQTIQPTESAGISDDEIVVEIPSAASADGRASVVATVLRHYAAKLNHEGGIYGRRIRMVEDGEAREAVFATLAALTPDTERRDVPLDLWPLHAKAGAEPAFPLIPPDDRLMEALLDAASTDDHTAERRSTFGDDAGALPSTIVFDGRSEELSVLIENFSGETPLTIYTTAEHVDLEALQSPAERPLRIVLANPFAPDRQRDGAGSTDQSAAFNDAMAALGLPEAARATARAAWVAATLLEFGLRATGRRLDRQRFEVALRTMTTLEAGLLLPAHPTRGLVAIELVTFDFAADQVTRRRLSLM